MPPTPRPLIALAVASALAAAEGAAPAAGPLGRAAAAVADATVVVGGYEVFATLADGGGGEAAGRRVVARLERDGDLLAVARARAGADGSVALPMVTSGARRHRPVRLAPGDRLVVAVEGEEGDARALTLPPLSASAAVGGRIEGVAPPGTRLTVTAATLDGDLARYTPVAGPDGRWSVDPAPLALGAGSSGAAFFGRDDVLWQASWTVPAIRPDGPEPPAACAGELVAPPAAGAMSLWLRMPSGHSAVATVSDPDGAIVARGEAIAWSGGGAEARLVLRDARGLPRPLRPGDALSLAVGDEPPYRLVLPQLAELEVSPRGDRVAGRAEPGAQVTVWPIGADAPVEATAGEDGAWAVEVAPASGPGAEPGVDVLVAASWPEAADGALDPACPGLRVRAFAQSVDAQDAVGRAVSGRGVAGETATLAVDDAAGSRHGTEGAVGPDGRFALALRDAGELQPLQVGDRFEVRWSGGAASSWAASPLRPRARAGRDAIEGDATPGSAVTVTVGAETRAAMAGADGAWRAVFGEAVDLQPGVEVAVRAAAPGGPVQALDFPVFRASVQSRGALARIEGPPGLAARVEVARDGTELASGECAIARASCVVELLGIDGEPVELAPDDEVLVVPADGSPAALDVIELSAHIDRSGSDVAGASPPGEAVHVAFTAPPGRPAPRDATVTADFNGVFDYELDRAEWELLAPGIRADVYYALPSGHQVFATGVVEQVVLEPGASGWEGLAEPGVEVAGEAIRGGRVVASARAVADPHGAYRAELRDAAGAPVALAVGDVLEVADGRRRVALEVPPLVAWFAPAGTSPDGGVVGWSAPERAARLLRLLPAVPGGAAVEVVAGAVDALGTFALGGGVDPAAATEAWVVVTLPDGDEIRRRVDGAAPPGWAAMPAAWR